MKRMPILIYGLGLLVGGWVHCAYAGTVDIGDFDNPTVIDFNDAPAGLIGTY